MFLLAQVSSREGANRNRQARRLARAVRRLTKPGRDAQRPSARDVCIVRSDCLAMAGSGGHGRGVFCVDCVQNRPGVSRPLVAFSGRRREARGFAGLFLFTPPDAAIRFADGARKSFSIATCSAPYRGPAVSKNDRSSSMVGGFRRSLAVGLENCAGTRKIRQAR